MLKPRCISCTWVKPELRTCHRAPSTKPGSQVPLPSQTARGTSKPPSLVRHTPLVRRASRSTRRLPEPPVSAIASHTPTLSAISAMEVRVASVGRSPPYAVRFWRVCRAPAEMHSGHWKPTEASRMQSGQIGRLQRWQRM